MVCLLPHAVTYLVGLLISSPHSKIVEKIDEDKDGFVTTEEMKRWIKFAQKRWIYDDVDRQWKGHDLNEDGVISWEEYKNVTYGYVLGRSPFLRFVALLSNGHM